MVRVESMVLRINASWVHKSFAWGDKISIDRWQVFEYLLCSMCIDSILGLDGECE